MGRDDFVIDNERVVLLNELRLFLGEADRVSVAVGYFFMSGFAEIMDSLERVESSKDPASCMRLLISPSTNRPTAEALLAANESYADVQRDSEMEPASGTGKAGARDDAKRTLEYMPQTEKDKAAVSKLASLIRQRKLFVKVYTRERLHAKAYILEDTRGVGKVYAFIGSSNLSISGIRDHAELNLRTEHPAETKQMLEWFERHWNDPGSQDFTAELADIIGKSWAGARRSPTDVYRKAALHEHDRIETVQPPQTGNVTLFDFQKIAFGSAIKKLDEYGGVIIADVVGMGKSIIGSAILRHLQDTKRSRPLIVCPPHLMGMWSEYADMFGINAVVASRYKIGMEDDILSKYTDCDVVLVDESHNFRYSSTNAYGALLSFMEEKPDDSYMIMLTATPISNAITDLKNQLKLFPSEKLATVPPLVGTTIDDYFKNVMDGNDITKEGAEKIRELLRHILIRRTKTQIQERHAKRDGDRFYLEQDGKRNYFPKRSLTNPAEYDVDKVYNRSFEPMHEAIRDLKLARYAPGNYVKEEYLDPAHPEYRKYSELASTTKPLVGIVRASLLKRMESSVAAFADSIEKYLAGHIEFRSLLDSGIVPVGKEFQEEIYKRISSADYDDETKLSAIKSQYDIRAFDVDRWKKDMGRDGNLFATIRGYLPSKRDYATNDDKLHRFREILAGMPSEKILVFTESAVTAKYIHSYLTTNKKGRLDRNVAQIDSKQGAKEKNNAMRRFDPKNNNAELPRSEEIDVLISTDVLSEGVNLQAGRVVINYDFHWNPVRLIQRVGRVDRIGSEHETIDIINFLPTTKIEEHLSLKGRVAAKITLIRSIMGGDQKILEATEEFDANAISAIYAGDEGVLESRISDPTVGDLLDTESESEAEADRIRNDGEELAKIRAMPFGMRSASGKDTLLIACEAKEAVIDGSGSVISERRFRRHYKVSSDGCKHIWALPFLSQLGRHAGDVRIGEPESYDVLVELAWREFGRDVRNRQAGVKLYKHQKYFDGELKRMMGDDYLAARARKLMPFVRQRMLPNHQPYRALVSLRKRLTSDAKANDGTVISELEVLREKHRGAYRMTIRKPRILYSVMVDGE